jgi:hypothetical protein
LPDRRADRPAGHRADRFRQLSGVDITVEEVLLLRN